jgi:hypothetical protein
MLTRADHELLAEWNSHRQGETVEERCDRVGNPPKNIRDAIQHTFDDSEPGALDPSSKMASVEAAVGSTVTTDTTSAATTGSGAGAGADSERNTKQRPKKAKKETKTFSIKRRLEILAKIRRSVTSQKAIIEREGTSKSAVCRWKGEESTLLKQIEGERRGDMKRQLKTDGLKRVKVRLYKFYELNDTMPKSLRIPLTREYYVLPCSS